MTGYDNIVWGTSVFALAICMVFAALVLRRYLAERNRARRDARDTQITRDYLQRVEGNKVDLSTNWGRNTQRAAISRILPLLRGGEKTRLLQIAELDGVLADTLRKSHGLYAKERVNAIHLLQRFGSEVCIGRLRELMARDPNMQVRLEAAFALAANDALPPPRETLRLIEALERQPTRLDIALLRSTAPLFPQQMILLLNDDLTDDWRALLIDAIGWSGEMDVIGTLEQAAGHASAEIRCAALRAVAKLGHPGAARWVLAALDDPVAAVRLQAIAAVMRLGLRSALPQLSQLTRDPELWVNLQADQAIEELMPTDWDGSRGKMRA